MTTKARRWLLTIGVDAALLALIVGTPVVAFSVLGPLEDASTAAASVDPLPDLELMLLACREVTEEWRMDCYLSTIYPVLETHGVAEAFSLLQALANADSWVLRKDHPMAHSLGREALLRLGEPSKVLVECPFGMASGCFHGTLEAFLSTRSGNLTPQDVRGVCSSLDTPETRFAFFQCLHGLGHGVTMHSDHDMFLALDHCDALPDWWTRESCYGGVFMENIVSFQVWSGLGVGEGILHNHDDEDGEVHHGWIYREDPQYPCNAVAKQYRGSCYNLQTTAFLTLNGYHVATAFRLCDQADPEWVHMCYLSMGRDISSIANRVPELSRDQCGEGNASWRSWCIVGVVKDFINSSGRSAPGFELCKLVLDEDKAACYKAIGEILTTLMPDRMDRWEECGLSEAGYLDDCRTGAAI